MNKNLKIIKISIPIVGLILLIIIFIQFKFKEDNELNSTINLKCLSGICVNDDNLIKCIYFKKKLSDVEYKEDTIIITPSLSICE